MSEQGIVKFLFNLPNAQPGSGVALDIGACQGLYSSFIAEKFEVVYAFEPDPDNFEALKKNLQMPNVVAINGVVGETTGTVKFHRNLINVGAGTISEAVIDHPIWGQQINSEDNKGGVIEVPSVTLDDFAKDHSNIRFIKCDIEGAENFIFEHGKEFLKNAKLTMLLEVHHCVHLNILYNLFKDLGYNIYYLDTMEARLSHIEDAPKDASLAWQPAPRFHHDVHFIVTNEK